MTVDKNIQKKILSFLQKDDTPVPVGFIAHELKAYFIDVYFACRELRADGKIRKLLPQDRKEIHYQHSTHKEKIPSNLTDEYKAKYRQGYGKKNPHST